MPDNEAHYLKIVMDEVFGRRNFISSFIWKKSYGGGAKAKWFVGLHEHINVYAKNLENFPEMFLPPDPEAVKKYYKFKDEKFEERGPFRLQPLATTSMDERPNLRFPIILDGGDEIWPEKQWQWSSERVKKALSNNELVFNEKNGKTSVSYKQYLIGTDGEEKKRKPKSIIEGIYTQHGTAESVGLFGRESKFSFPKPEALIEQIIESCTSENEIILDSFLGSGTTAAVAHKMNRRYIGIEMGDHAFTHCQPRLQKVIDGEQGGISKAVSWQGGGGFTYYRLGEAVFDEAGHIRDGVSFAAFASYLWFLESGTPLLTAPETPFLGEHNGQGIYLLYNGILGDRRPQGGNVLTSPILAGLPAYDGPRIIYGESCRLGNARLQVENIRFRQIPYEVSSRQGASDV